MPYVLVVKTLEEALRFNDGGVNVVMAAIDAPSAFENLGLERAAMLVATSTDVANTSVAFTARALAPDITIVGTANAADSVDVLQLAGCDHVIQKIPSKMTRTSKDRLIGIPSGPFALAHPDRAR